MSKKQKKPAIVKYPATPYVIGLDWIELVTRDPLHAAELLVQIGFAPRGTVGADPLVAIGGMVLRLRPRAKRNGRTPDSMLPTVQLAVDHINRKHAQLSKLKLRPGKSKRQPRGDVAFECRVLDALVLRFVGPERRKTDKTLY